MENENNSKRRKTLLLNHLIFLAVAVLYMVVMVKLRIYCPIRHFTGIPCAGCGMSRAAVSLLHLDLKGSLYNNPALLPCLAAIFFLIHRDTRMLSRINKHIVSIIIYAGFAFTVTAYLVRMIFFEIP
jgi:acyl-ACP thioesterase